MGCRVGMSTDPQERINYWKRVEGHTHSEILARKLTYVEASSREKTEASRRGCVSHGGGDRVPGRVYSVYHVWGGRTSA